MSTSITFASIGNELKICTSDVNGLSEKAVYNVGYSSSGKSKGRQFSWAGDGLWISGPPDETGNLPVLKFEDQKKLTRMRTIPKVSAATFMTHTNRYMAIASEDGGVKLWDIKLKAVHKTLCESRPEPVNYLDVSWDDNFVAACGHYSEKPSVKIYGVTTSRLMHSLPLHKPAEFSSLRFSSVKKSSLACSTMEGEIVLWDVRKASVLMERKDVHNGCCVGLALSPINYNVLASISMDGVFLLHDAREKKTVGEIRTNHSLTSTDLIRTAPQVLMGTSDGRILLYDLRNGMQIGTHLQAHESAVQCLRTIPAVQTTTKQIEELLVNTPDEAVVSKPVLEMSVADVCTPPSNISVLPRSGEKEANELDAISPLVAFYNDRRTSVAHSTPNPVITSLANQSDSFLKLFASPAGLSPATRSHASPRPTSTLSFRQAVLMNGIKEELEGAATISPITETPPSTNGHSSPRTPGDAGRFPSGLRDVVREVVREEMNDLRSYFTDQFQEIRSGLENLQAQARMQHGETAASLVRNREHTIFAYQTVGQLANLIRLSNAFSTIGEFDDDPSFFRE